MAAKIKTYWIAQLTGWLFYVLINLIFFELTSNASINDYVLYFIIIPFGIGLTHTYRFVLKKIKADQFKLLSQIIFIILSSSLLGACLYTLLSVFSKLFQLNNQEFSFLSAISSIINFSVVFFVWNIIYFGYHYFTNYKKAEINNLRLEAAGKESELNSLKAQLNPHFMFNSMNSIRALIDEDPGKAKLAVTQLSNILRNSLLMNKSKEITLEEEVSLVIDYLELEKIRYEERLHFTLNIEAKTKKLFLPPLIIQGQVENAIKHGISKLPEGGEINVNTFIKDNFLKITVSNSGKLNTEKSATGLGFQNSLQRLQLMYGRQATISIKEDKENNMVITEINIPLNNKQNL